MQFISRKGLKPAQLPPTEEAAVKHVLPVYLQITYWKALSNTEIGPRLRDWNKENELFEPVMTQKVSYFLERLIACQQNVVLFILNNVLVIAGQILSF